MFDSWYIAIWTPVEAVRNWVVIELDRWWFYTVRHVGPCFVQWFGQVFLLKLLVGQVRKFVYFGFIGDIFFEALLVERKHFGIVFAEFFDQFFARLCVNLFFYLKKIDLLEKRIESFFDLIKIKKIYKSWLCSAPNPSVHHYHFWLWSRIEKCKKHLN